MRSSRLRQDFPLIEVLFSIVGHLAVGGGVVIFDSIFGSPEVEEVEEDQSEFVQVTQVNLARKAEGHPDKASSSSSSDVSTPPPEPSLPARSGAKPTPTVASEVIPRETSSEPAESKEDVLDSLPELPGPEGSIDREETSSEGAELPIRGMGDVGPNTPLGRWMTECAIALRRDMFLQPQWVTNIRKENPDASVVIEVTIADDGSLSDAVVRESSGSSQDSIFFDDSVRRQTDKGTHCPPRPAEAADFSHRTRIRVPVTAVD